MAWAGRNGNGGAFGTFLERIPGFAIQNIPDSLPRRYRSYKRLHITDLRYVSARLHSRRSYTMRNVYATLHRLHTSYVRTKVVHVDYELNYSVRALAMGNSRLEDPVGTCQDVEHLRGA